MYFSQGYTAIQGREGEGTEELGIPSSVKFPDHAGTLLKQPKTLKKKPHETAEIKYSWECYTGP